MPWKSDAQRRWGNSPAGHKALGDAGVAEWNSASKGKKLPEKLAKGGLVPGKVVNEAPKLDMKGIVKPKSENLAGTPRSAAIHPHARPGAEAFKSVTRIKDRREYGK